MRHLMMSVALALLLASPVAWAQESVVVPGARVRITGFESDRSARRAGTVVTAGGDTVVLRLDPGGETMPFAMAGITRVELSRGLKGHTGAGIGLGLLAGFGVGAVVGYTSCGTCGGGEDDQISKLLGALAWGGIIGGGGMLVGGLVGAHHKTERWDTVPSNRWRFSVGPRREGFALALSRSS